MTTYASMHSPACAEVAVPTAGVLVATYRRAPELVRCLHGLVAQTHAPDEVMIVCREDDAQTLEAVRNFPPGVLTLRVVTVDKPGLIHARVTACAACQTDILAMIDDDTVPHPDWLARVVEHFRADPRVGGVGGRDRCHDGASFDDAEAEPVGKVQWYGRIIGNNHLGFGKPREIDVLKGANMSYRAKVFEQVSFDTRLRGAGSQPCEDISFSFNVKHAGWKLIYDPAAVVDHYLGRRDEVRHYGGVAPLTDVQGFRNFAFNEFVAIWDGLSPVRRAAFCLWSALVGTGVCPGLVQAVRFTPRMGLMAWRRFFVAQQGKLQAFRLVTSAAGRRPAVTMAAAPAGPRDKPVVFIVQASEMLTDHLPNGDGLVAYGFLKSLAQRGWTLHVAAPQIALRDPVPPNMTLHPIQVRAQTRIAGRLEYMLRARLLLRRLRRRGPIDLVHQMNPVSTGLSLCMLGTGLPVVLGTYIARWPSERAVTSVGAAASERTGQAVLWVICLLQQAAASVLLLTAPAARRRVAAPKLMESKIVYLRHGIDTAQFAPTEEWQADVAVRPYPSILFYSQVDTRKGIYVLMDAYRLVLQTLPDCRLTIAGRGAEIEAIRAQIETLEKPSQVALLGLVDRSRAPALFRGHSVYCLPSFGEPYATSVIEAMSCASPLVVTNTGGLPHMIPPDGGLRVTPGDAAGLAAALIEILRSPALQISMGEANRAYALQHYAWAQATRALEDVYCRLVPAAGVPAANDAAPARR